MVCSVDGNIPTRLIKLLKNHGNSYAVEINVKQSPSALLFLRLALVKAILTVKILKKIDTISFESQRGLGDNSIDSKSIKMYNHSIIILIPMRKSPGCVHEPITNGL